ncbi:MAG: DUF4202 domain-containing protein [Deltaproteobacteria bacterium]|nr:DUF4202 domain-containing protein [Deltaproteobacteria bacterium]
MSTISEKGGELGKGARFDDALLREAEVAFSSVHAGDARTVVPGVVVGAGVGAGACSEPAAVNWSQHYHARMLHWVLRLEPTAGLALRLAAMAQHLGRYRYPRSDFDDGRAGYLAWRSHAAARQAEAVDDILEGLGADEPLRARVRAILLKQNLAHDPEVQTLEDAACLVFFELEFEALSHKHDETTLLRVLRKTWKKMSKRGRREALSMATTLPPTLQRILQDALTRLDEGLDEGFGDADGEHNGHGRGGSSV